MERVPVQKVGETWYQYKEISFGGEVTDHSTEQGRVSSALFLKKMEGWSGIPKREPWEHPEGMARNRCQSSPDKR